MARAPLPPVLVAEDDANDLFLLCRQLTEAGVEAPLHTFRDGQELIDFLQSLDPSLPRPRLLLIDLKMPRVDGFEVLEWLRNEPAWRELKVVVLSGSDEPRDIERTTALGATRYCVKPATAPLLIELLASIS